MWFKVKITVLSSISYRVTVEGYNLWYYLYLPRFWLIATVIAFAHETNTTKKHSNGTKYHLNEETPKKKFNIAKSSFSNTAQWIQITWNPVDFLSKITFRIPEFIFEVKTFWGFYGFINVIDPLRGVSAFFWRYIKSFGKPAWIDAITNWIQGTIKVNFSYKSLKNHLFEIFWIIPERQSL